MPYAQQSWLDGSSGGTPVTAARLDHMEAGIAAAAGSSSLTAAVVGAEVDVTVTSNWGIDSGGNAYYDPAGASSADAAIATLGADGTIVLTDARGGVATVAVTSVNGHTGAVVVVTKADVGLGNVDNVSDANKPVSSATQTALNLKANTASLATVATTGAYADLTGKPTIPATKADIGLGNCDNVADANKPVSTAQAAFATSRAVAMALVLGS
jgi:hypothetical protein